MKYPVITAAILIEASGAALNNAGSDPNSGLDNAVAVKQIGFGNNKRPYISGQAIRRWWREVLYSDFGWAPSPVTREAKSAYTQGDPITYEDDDIFGYMAAKKATKKKMKGTKSGAEQELSLADDAEIDDDEPSDSGGTQRRVSPLKNSLLISVAANVITSDFGLFSRDLPVENPDMVLFGHEHYTALLQGTFCISLTDVGRFECGPMRDLASNAPQNGATVVSETDGLSKPRVLALSADERRARIAQTVEALARLRHGANLTRNLSDVAPVVILIGFVDGGNSPFQNLFTNQPDGVGLNLARLESVVKDYADRLHVDKTLFFGFRPGVLKNEAEVLASFKAGIGGVTFIIDSPGTVINKFADMVRKSSAVPESLT